MKYLAAYALCALNGTPTKDQVKKVLKAGGVDVDAARLDEVFAQFEGKDFGEVSAAGKAKIGSGAGGAGGASSAAPAGGAAKPAAAAAAPADEEEEDDGMMGLFD